MRRFVLSLAGLAGVAALTLVVMPTSDARIAKKVEKMLCHDVFFKLKKNAPADRQKLVQACVALLKGHEGEVFFAAGTVCEELKREVNDRDWDVALHIVFKDMAAHDKYQDHERHKKFIDENKGNWDKVRVFDSWVVR